jgi:hypothetical protein
MSQQYGPPGQQWPGQYPQGGPQQPPPGPPPMGPPPVGPPPAGPFGYPPGQFQRPPKSKVPMYAVIGAGALAVALVVVGAVLLIRGGGEDEPSAAPTSQPASEATSQPTDPVLPSATPTEPEITKGPNDVGVEVGKGVWFTPARGWIRDTDKKAGANYLLPEPGRRGAIDGWFWARQTTFRNAKDFAHHLVDIESNNLENVRIVKGRELACPAPALKTCYAINYSAVVRFKDPKRPPVIFAGFVQAFEDQNGVTTATDAALQREVYRAKYPEVQSMNQSLVKSYL